MLFESNETNNTRALAIHLTAPDLTPTALTVAATPVAGRQVEVSWMVKNQGDGEAGPYFPMPSISRPTRCGMPPTLLS